MTDTIDPNRGKIGGTVREHIRQLEAALATSEAARVKAEAALRKVAEQTNWDGQYCGMVARAALTPETKA